MGIYFGSSIYSRTLGNWYNGLTTPPCGVPCSGNSGLIPVFRQRNIPVLMPFGAMSRSRMLARAYPVEAFFDVEFYNSFLYSVANGA
jgi:hypothetical protein